MHKLYINYAQWFTNNTCYFTQPFFTTEQFTSYKGKLVSLDDALDGCERILNDEFKNVPESALYMIGAISEVKIKSTVNNNEDTSGDANSDTP